MGGAPGTSKGCNTCRRRKKGCDKQRPSCGQCQKAGLTCAGYERSPVWVTKTPETLPAASRQQRDGASSAVTLHGGLARTAYTEQYVGSFWASYLPGGRLFPPESTIYTTGVWTNEIHRMFYRDGQETLRKTMMAVALTTAGRRDDKPWMLENGLRLYGSSLAALAAQIQEQKGPASDGILAAAKILGLYEILHGHDIQDRIAQIKNWNSHLQGESGFLISRGPRGCARGFTRQLFIDGRTTQISTSLLTRQPSFLNSADWKTLPWSHTPKNARDLLGDIFAELPSLLAETDRVIAEKDPWAREEKRAQLVQSCLRLERDWRDWQRRYRPDTSPVVSPATQTQPNSIFAHFVAAHIMSDVYSMGVIIYATLHRAYHPRDAGWLSARQQATFCCAGIAELLPTFLNPHSGEFGMHGAIFSSIIALLYLKEVEDASEGELRRKVHRVFAIGERGKTIERFVISMCQRVSDGENMFFPFIFT